HSHSPTTGGVNPDRGKPGPATDNIFASPTLVPPTLSTYEAGSLAGQVFGDFELVEELGRGGMGVVYKAKQRSLERFVAMKLLLAEHACNPGVLTRFMTEARSAASLTHP